jgi:hypothetical protein
LRVDDRLNPNYPLPFNFPLFCIAVLNEPVSPEQLNRKAIVIFNRNPVREHKLLLEGIGIIRLIELFNTDLDALSDF